MKKIYFILMFNILIIGHSEGQTFHKRYYESVGIGGNVGTGFTEALNKAIVMSGYNNFSTPGSRNWQVTRVDSNGTILSSWQYNFGGDDFNCNIKQTNDSGYVVYGTASGTISLLKVAKTGTVQWSNRIIGVNAINDILTLSNGDMVIGTDFAIVKMDASGNILWSRKSGNALAITFNNIILNSSGNYLCVGQYNSNIEVMEIAPNGSLLWAQTHQAPALSYGYKVVQTTDNGYGVLCYYNGQGFLIKLNQVGTVLWSIQVPIPSSASTRDIAALASNKILVSSAAAGSPFALQLEEINSLGTTAIDYQATIPTPAYSFNSPQVLKTSSGRIYVKASSSGATQYFNLVRLNSNYTGCSSAYVSTGPTTTYTFTLLAGAPITTTALTTSSLNPVFSASTSSVLSICSTSAMTIANNQINALCNGQCNGSATVTPNGGQSPYTYLWTPGSQTTSIRTSLCAGTYSCAVTDAFSITAVSVITITQPSAISLTTTASSNSICSGNSATLAVNGSGGTGSLTYTWQPGNLTNTSVAVSPNATTIYTVTGMDANNCTTTSNISLTVSPSPTITVNSGSICSGNSFTIVPNGASTYTIQGGSAVVSPTANSSYTVIGTSTAGCVSSNTAMSNVTVNATPTISVAGGAICPGNSFTFNPSGANTYTYAPSGPVVSPTVTSTYSVTGTSSAGCLSNGSAVATVTVTNSLTVTITGSNTICSGQTINLAAGGASTYTWNTSATTTTIAPTPTANTTYSVIGASGSCSNTAMFSVTVNPLPTVSATTNNTLICVGQSATLTAGGASTYTWNPGGAGTSIVVSPTTTSNYTVTGTSAQGCNNSSVFTQSVSTCAGINQIGNSVSELNIYPNPFNNKITIVSNAGKQPVLVFNALGSLIYKTEIENGKTEIDLSKENAGIYFIRVGTGIKKVMKE